MNYTPIQNSFYLIKKVLFFSILSIWYLLVQSVRHYLLLLLNSTKNNKTLGGYISVTIIGIILPLLLINTIYEHQNFQQASALELQRILTQEEEKLLEFSKINKAEKDAIITIKTEEFEKWKSEETNKHKQWLNKPLSVYHTNGSLVEISTDVLRPIRLEYEKGTLSKFQAVMIISLHGLESYGSKWQAKGTILNNGDYAIGINQLMRYASTPDASQECGISFDENLYFSDISYQINLTKCFMQVKSGNTRGNTKDSYEAGLLAAKWLGGGCDIHGTCTNRYASLAVQSFNNIFDQF
jgi:hypothetical protein